MTEYKRIEGCTYAGEVPKVWVQAPITALSPTVGHCTDCGSAIHSLDITKAICAVCIVRAQSSNKSVGADEAL